MHVSKNGGDSWDPVQVPTVTPERVMSCNFLGLKDSAYFCYCTYVLRIARYTGFLWVVPTITGIFLRGLKLCGESRT